jgi:hypothetical protein
MSQLYLTWHVLADCTLRTSLVYNALFMRSVHGPEPRQLERVYVGFCGPSHPPFQTQETRLNPPHLHVVSPSSRAIRDFQLRQLTPNHPFLARALPTAQSFVRCTVDIRPLLNPIGCRLLRPGRHGARQQHGLLPLV